MRKTRVQVGKIIENYKETLHNFGINAERVILYGSFAKGKQSEVSDIDLVIITKDFEKMNLRKRLEILGIAAVRIMKPIEALGYTPKEIKSAPRGSFLEEILATGVIY